MSQNIGGTFPAVSGGDAYEVIDEVVSTRHTVQLMTRPGRTFSIETIDDVVAGDTATIDVVTDAEAILARSFAKLSPILQGKLTTIEVIKTDIARELAQGRVPAERYTDWTPPDVDHPVIAKIFEALDLSFESEVKVHIVPITMVDEVNQLIHGFIPEAFAACGYYDHSVHRGTLDITCNIVEQVENVFHIVKGYGFIPELELIGSTD